MSENGKVPYPGKPTTTDGAGHVVWVETNITHGACAYPITSSTTMGSGYQAQVAAGKENLWGDPIQFMELESEHSSASTCEGFALAGGRVSNFTSGQGLILMKEVLYTISGKRLPVVFHIGARAMTSQALNVHAGHDDVMGVADTGWGILFARNAQEAGDLALIARRTAEDSETPFLNVQDGFLTTHTVQNVLLAELEFMKEYIGDPKDRLRNLMDVENPMMSGVVQNQDAYMKGKIAQRFFYDRLMTILEHNMKIFSDQTGRHYAPVSGYKLEDAEYVLVGMGSYMETALPTVDYLREHEGIKVGALNVTAFNPFPGAQIVEALQNAKGIAVLERMDNPLAQSNPLTAGVKGAFVDSLTGTGCFPKIDHCPPIYTGCAGLGSRDVRAGDLIAAVDMMVKGSDKRFFTLGIKHATALPVTRDPDVRPNGAFSMRGHSVGGYGSVTTNKIIATMAGDIFGLQVQAYPKYGSEKKGLPTTYYLTLAKGDIQTHCELRHVEFIPLNDINAFNVGNPLMGLSDGGMVFIQTFKTDPKEMFDIIPERAKRLLKEKKARVFGLNTVQIAKEVAPVEALEMRMQGIVLLGIFLRVTPFCEEQKVSDEKLFEGVEKALRKYFGSKGEKVVAANMTAVRRGYEEVFEVDQEIIQSWESSSKETVSSGV